jgi:hypothetical protein
MNKFRKLDEAKNLLMAEYNNTEIVYAMLYGYLASMVDDTRAEAVLEMVKDRYATKEEK